MGWDGLQWCDDFSFPLKNLTACIALIVLLRTGGLVTKSQASTILGLDTIPSSKLQLATEDYLHGLINAINDLSRLAVNSVTLGDFRTPVRLATFVKQVHSGFQLLNLKNDSLRKRFDGIKVSPPPHSLSSPAFLYLLMSAMTMVKKKHCTMTTMCREWNCSLTKTFTTCFVGMLVVRCEKDRGNRLRYLPTWPSQGRGSRPRRLSLPTR